MTTLVCPQDQGKLATTGQQATCERCGSQYQQIDGVWHMLTAEQEADLAPFIQDYETIRQAEGRTGKTAAWYRELPYTAPSDGMSAMWQQRAHSFEQLLRSVIIPQETAVSPPLNILDLGAGNGWLSHQLSARGHRVTAVDILVNSFDGLGCHQQYPHQFTAVQASFSQLPIDSGTIDLVIFNASFHYATSYLTPLQEAWRVTRPNGQIVIVDTPVYLREESGLAMVAEREARFTEQYGFPSNHLPSENFLTYGRLTQLSDQLSAGHQLHHLHPTGQRAWRRLKVTVKRQREAAEFPIIVWQR